MKHNNVFCTPTSYRMLCSIPPSRYQEELAIVEAELAVLERQIAQQRNVGGGMYGGGLYGGGGMGVSAVPPEELERLKKQRTALQVWG